MNFSSKRSRGVTMTVLLTIVVWGVEAGGAQLNVTWVDPFLDQLGFSVERSTETTGTFAEIATTGAGVTAYTDPSVEDATTYCYRVRAFNAAGYSDYSNVACSSTPQTFGLAVVNMGSGSGTVTSSPAGITCGATCSASYFSGTVVTLTATPATDSAFTGWSGSDCVGTDSCTVTLTATTTVTASFDFASTVLTVVRIGKGRVTSTPAGIMCGRRCLASFSPDTAVTLDASGYGGYVFAGWSGGGCDGTGACTVSVTAATTVTATFIPAEAMSVWWTEAALQPAMFTQRLALIPRQRHCTTHQEQRIREREAHGFRVCSGPTIPRRVV